MPSKPRPLIVVIGSINMDLVVPCHRLPGPGETILGGALATFPGGKGANQAVAAARLGARVAMVGRVGDDGFGRTLRDGLEANRVDVRHVKITRGVASGAALILVQPGGENSIVASLGANARVTPADVDAAIPLIRAASVVLLQLEIPLATVRHAIKVCRRLGVKTVLDPAPAPKDGVADAFYKVDVISPNETEACVLLKLPGDDPQRICRALRKRGPRDVVLKLGKHGALHGDASHVFTQVKGFKIEPVDTTAAGDAFTGALAVAMSEGKSWADALRFANATGALACTKLGAQPSLPTRAAVNKLLGTAGNKGRGPRGK